LALLSLQAASSPLDPYTPDGEAFSLILIFYHLVSVAYRRLSGVSDFGLWPLSDSTGARRSITPGGGVWRKFWRDFFSALMRIRILLRYFWQPLQ
jgi:hypothetical protein